MQPTARSIANGLAWLVIFGLIALSVILVEILGFPGVILLGLATMFVCSMAELHEDGGDPRYDVAPDVRRSPELRAAEAAEREAAAAPFRYYRRCGLALIAAGLAGIAWQIWQ